MTSDELRTALQDGSTIAEVAAAQGVDVQTVIDALVAEATTRIAERVTAGDLTQAEADAKIADLTTRITEQVNSGMPMGGPGRGHHDDDVDGDDDVATTEPATPPSTRPAEYRTTMVAMSGVINKVLVVDDDRAIRESLARALELDGYDGRPRGRRCRRSRHHS